MYLSAGTQGVGTLSQDTDTSSRSTLYKVLWGALGVAGTAISAYHGYKRNKSVGWAIWWGLMGGIFPVVTVPVAFAQGFGKRAKK